MNNNYPNDVNTNFFLAEEIPQERSELWSNIAKKLKISHTFSSIGTEWWKLWFFAEFPSVDSKEIFLKEINNVTMVA